MHATMHSTPTSPTRLKNLASGEHSASGPPKRLVFSVPLPTSCLARTAAGSPPYRAAAQVGGPYWTPSSPRSRRRPLTRGRHPHPLVDPPLTAAPPLSVPPPLLPSTQSSVPNEPAVAYGPTAPTLSLLPSAAPRRRLGRQRFRRPRQPASPAGAALTRPPYGLLRGRGAKPAAASTVDAKGATCAGAAPPRRRGGPPRTHRGGC